MISKKEALTLGMLAIGGVGAAMVISGGNGAITDTGALEGKKGRAGQILGSGQQPGAVYNFPAQGAVSFPAPPTYDMSRFLPSLPTTPVPAIGRGAAGISAAPKKSAVTPYLYTGGEVKAGAVSVAPWAMGTTTPAEIGVTTALSIAQKPSKKYDYMGTGMTQSEYASLTAHRTYSSPTTAKKTLSDASKAVSHAKRLRAGRGD